MQTNEIRWFPGEQGSSSSKTELCWLSGEEKFEKSGSQHSKRCDLSFLNYRSAYLWKWAPDTTGGYDNPRILGVLINTTMCAPSRHAQSAHARSQANSEASHANKASVSISSPSLLMYWRRTRNRFALLLLERLLIEQRPTRHQNENYITQIFRRWNDRILLNRWCRGSDIQL